MIVDIIWQQIHVTDGEITNFLANFGRIDIKDSLDAETTILESLVSRDGMTEVASADENNIPHPINVENVGQLINQVRDGVPSSLFTEFTEMGEIFADLHCREAES